MIEKITFWKLLKDKNISIPAIQRDYVQGRVDFKTTQIREEFIAAIFAALQDKQPPLNLYFIYGNTDRASSSFVPVDGQQRLTMLFLIHWYLAAVCGKLVFPEVKKRLLRFQYATRFTTQIFCQYLVEAASGILEQLGNNAKLQLTDRFSWFAQFGMDPSVRSMLVVLEAIHQYIQEKRYSAQELEKMWRCLTEETPDPKIYFRCLDIENDLCQTDNIYIKMNARGKPLTDFEIFKVDIPDFLSDKNFSTEFAKRVNSKWAQFFWSPRYRKSLKNPQNKELYQEVADSQKNVPVYKEITIDSQMMRFFRFWILMEFIVRVKPDTAVLQKKSSYEDDKKIIEAQNPNFKSKNTIRDLFKRIFETLEKEADYIFVKRLLGKNKKVYNAFQYIKVSEDIQISAVAAPIGNDTFEDIYKLLDILAFQRREINRSPLPDAPLSFIPEEDKKEWNKEYMAGGEESAFLRLIGGENLLSAEDKLMLFAEYAFLIKYASKNEKETQSFYFFDSARYGKALQEWLRLVYNLIHYYLLDDEKTWDHLFDRIRSIHTLLQDLPASLPTNIRDFRRCLWKALSDRSASGRKNLPGFSVYQQREERIKYQLMLQSEKWRAKILETEKDTYLDGTMEVLFDFAGITECPQEENLNPTQDTEKDPLFEKFCFYLKNLSLLLSERFLKQDAKELFRRALLCYGGTGSYLIENSFLAWDKRDPFSFKRLLRRETEQTPPQRQCIKAVIDGFSTTEDSPEKVEEELAKIIVKKRESFNRNEITDPDENWKKIFLEKPILIHDVGAAGIYTKPRRRIARKNAHDILLISKDSIHSINREVYSYVLWYELHTDYAQKITSQFNKKENEVFGYEASIGARLACFKDTAASYIGYETKYLWYKLTDQTKIHVHYAQKGGTQEWKFIAIEPKGDAWEFRHVTDSREEMLKRIAADLGIEKEAES